MFGIQKEVLTSPVNIPVKIRLQITGTMSLTDYYLPQRKTKLWERDPRIVVGRDRQRGQISGNENLSTNTREGGWVEP